MSTKAAVSIDEYLRSSYESPEPKWIDAAFFSPGRPVGRPVSTPPLAAIEILSPDDICGPAVP